MGNPLEALHRSRRAVLARRRGLSALCAGLAVAVAVHSQAAPAPDTSEVWVAARDIAAGVPLAADDLSRVPFTPGSVPDGAVEDRASVLGRTTTGPVRRGEPLTDVRVLGPGLLARHPGAVAAPVRVADRDAVALLRVGDRVDVLAADPRRATPAGTVAAGVPVVALPKGSVDGGPGTGALVVVAVSPETARRVAGAGAAAYLSVVVVR